MIKTFKCPKCGAYKKINGQPGEKKYIICNNCGLKGFVILPGRCIKKYFGFTKKQIVTSLIFVALLIILTFTIFLPTFEGDIHFLTVRSGSMEPEIKTGNVVVSTKIDPSSIKIGDVITFHYTSDENPNRCYTHRVYDIIKTNDDSYVFQTKGDNNEDVDAKYVKPSEVIGRVCLVLPYFGYLGEFARSLAGYILFLVLPTVLIILFEIRRIFKTNNKTKILDKN